MTFQNKKQSNVAYVSRRAFISLAAAGAGAVLIPSNALASNSASTFEIADSLRRTVSIKNDGNKCIIPLGPNAQAFLEILCPNSLASLVVPISEEAPKCASNSMSKLDVLPLTGNAHNASRKATSLLQESDDIKPSLILDVGIPKDNTESELDSLEKETGIPCAFIDISFGKLPDAFRKVSVLLGCTSRGEKLAGAVEHALELSACLPEHPTSPTVFYAPRENGIKARSGISTQVAAIKHIGARPLTSPYDRDNRTVNFETLAKENPDIIVFDDTNIVSLLKDKNSNLSTQWNSIQAIEWGRFVVSPSLVKSWFGSIVLVQSIGVLWLAKMLNPESDSYDLVSEIQNLYSLFYGLEKSEEEINSLIG